MNLLLQSPALVACRTAGPFATNTWLLACPETRQAVLVDASARARDIAPVLEAHQLTLQAVLLTHAHIDHILGLADMQRTWDVPVYLHPDDAFFYEGAAMQAQMFGVPCESPARWTHDLHEGTTIEVGTLRLQTLTTPGHAPGHVIFHEAQTGLLFGGDLVFAGSIGRTDLPGCDPAAMQESLRRVLALPDETRIFPGHMGDTTVGAERRANPFLRALAPG